MSKCLSKFCNHANPEGANFCEQCGCDLNLDKEEIEARDTIMEMFNGALENVKDKPEGLEKINRRFIDYYIQKNGASLAMKFMERTVDIVAKRVKERTATKPVPKGLYGLFFQRLHTLPKTSGGIIKFPDVFRALSQIFPITKENAWEILFLMRDFGLIEVIAGHGIKILNTESNSKYSANMDMEIIEIPHIELKWSKWFSWNELRKDVRCEGGINIPNRISGVYEVRYTDAEERLTIGKASNLRMRVRQGLIKGKTKHSSGKQIRANEDVSRLVVRWAVTDRPACAEEELHKKYREKFGRMPKYTKHT